MIRPLPVIAFLFGAVSFSPGNNPGVASADDQVYAWGMNSYSQCNVPADYPLGCISASYFVSAGVTYSGAVLAWGMCWTDNCTVPPPNEGFVAVACGANHSLGLEAGGSIVAWGSGQLGQCSVPEPNAGFVAVAADYDYVL